MKKKIGLISLLAAGISVVALTGCDGPDEKSKSSQADVSGIQEEVKTLQDSLGTTKSSLEEAINKINLYLKIEQIATNGDAVASLEAKIRQLEETSNANLNTKVQELNALLTNKAEKDELTEAISAVNTALNSKASTTALASLGETVDAIQQNYATNESVTTAINNLKEELASKTELDAVSLRIKAIEDSLVTDYVTSTNFENAIAELTALDAEIQLAIGNVLKVDDQVVSLQEQINKLESTKATIQKLEDLGALLDTKTKDLSDKIANIEKEIGEIALDEDEEVISLQEQINLINQKIGEIALDSNNEIISLQAQIDDIKEQIGDYSSSNELKQYKAELVYQLSDSYATFRDEMEHLRYVLTVTYHKDVNELFDSIYSKYDHDMQGNLYKGITLITLSKNAEEAAEVEAEYEVLINNFINPAKFELIKTLDLAIIDNVPTTIDVPSGDGELTVRQKLTKEVEDVKWFTDAELEEFMFDEEDDDDTKREKSLAYKAATQEKLDLMNAAAAKANIIDDFLTYYNTARTSINNSLSADKYIEANIAFLEILDDEIYDLDAYYNCKNIDIEITEIDPVTETEKVNTYNDLEYELEEDCKAIDLILAEVSNYIALNNYVDQELNKVNTGTGKLEYVASKVSGERTELDDFNEEVASVIDYDNYAILNNTIEKSGIQLAEDKAIVDLYIVKGKAYNELIKYCNDSITSVNNILKDSTQEVAEKTTVNTLIGAIHKYDNYITADLVISIPEGTTDTTLKTVADQLKDDKAAADLLVKRAQTFKNIYDGINAASTGLVAYIDAKTAKVSETSVNLFVSELKNKFKAEFTDLAVAAKYDAAIATFTTQQNFTDYESSILGEEGKLDLIKKNVDVFANILVIDAVAKSTINGYADLTSEYKTAFIDNFKAYATYDTNNTNTKDFTTKAAFDTYYTDTVKTHIDNIVKVAKYENDLINKAKSVLAKIDTAYTENKISADVKGYLVGVVNNIYTTNTSVTTVTENEEEKLVTLQTIADDAYTTVAAKLIDVQNAITTFHNIDVAAAVLETKLNNYKSTQEKIFLDTNYRYRDDEVYAPDAVNKYNGYNQAGLAAWLFYEEDFDDEIDEITYEYVVPTAEADINYASFINYMAELETPTQIGDRYNEIELWYSKDTQDDPKAGMLYTITAKFEELDSEKLEDCKEFFIGKLETLKNELKELVSNDDVKGNLENLFIVNKGIISGEYGKTTSSIIFSYENGVTAIENEYNNAILSYRTDALSQLLTMFNVFKEDNPELTEAYTTIYNNYNTKLSASEYSYVEDSETKTKAWTEALIDDLLEAAEADFDYVEVLAYKDNILDTLGTDVEGYIETNPTMTETYNGIYNTYEDILNSDMYVHMVEEDEVTELWTKDILDAIYAAAIDDLENA